MRNGHKDNKLVMKMILEGKSAGDRSSATQNKDYGLFTGPSGCVKPRNRRGRKLGT
jgi:hypothetical protein